MKSPSLRLLATAFALVLVLGCDGGNDRSAGNAAPGGASSAETANRWRDEIFTYAVDNLNRLEDSGTGEILPQVFVRLQKLAQQDPGSWDPKTDSLALTWPEPDMLRQVVNRLNQWLPTQKAPSDWRRDPLVEQLPPSLRDLPPLEDAAAMEFSSYDGFMLEEAVWLRDLSNWARGNTLDDLQRARKLFDWTVRNIQLDPESVDRTPLLPREVLLLGHGTALERAWVFILLARQQRLDAAVLALDKGAATRKPAAAKEDPGGVPAAVPLVDLQPWCVAVLVEGKQLYLFDPRLGLPIPAPGPIAVDHNGQLDIHPATLAQAAADDGLLRRLDLNADLPYPVKAADLKHAVLLVEGSPQTLARRMKLLESHLAGKQATVLTASPAAQAQRLAQAAGPQVTAQLWALPYEALERRLRLPPQRIIPQLLVLLPFYALPSAPLYRGRVLHLKGQFDGEDGATSCYQAARPADDDIKEGLQAERSAIQKMPPPAQARAVEEANVKAHMCLLGKNDASYWLGLIAFEQENDASAIDYFTKRTLNAVDNSPWQVAATYNAARAYEALRPAPEGHPVVFCQPGVARTVRQPVAGRVAGTEGGRTKAEGGRRRAEGEIVRNPLSRMERVGVRGKRR